MIIELPQNVEFIIATLEQEGHEAFVVGGCVRDAIRGMQPKDWDICTSALPEQTMECFITYNVIETGLKHGTVTLMMKGEPFEITTYRTEGTYSDNRHPDVVSFVGDIQEDLARRDFTINAMAYNAKEGLIDPFNGRGDIEQRMVRAVGNAAERFKEDALRMMRALRFAAVLGFDIEDGTFAAILKSKQLLQSISAERIASELTGILLGENVEKVLLEYVQVLEVPIPEISDMVGFNQNNSYHFLDVWQHTARSVAQAPKDRYVRLTMLLHDTAKPHCYTEAKGIGHFYGHPQVSADMARLILKRLRFDRVTIETVTELITHHDAVIVPQEKHIKRWLNRIGEERLRQLIEVKRADIKAQSKIYESKRLADLDNVLDVLNEIIKQQECFSLKDLAINGNDLLAAGIPEGREIGFVLNELLEKVIDGAIANDKAELLSHVCRIQR